MELGWGTVGRILDKNTGGRGLGLHHCPKPDLTTQKGEADGSEV